MDIYTPGRWVGNKWKPDPAYKAGKKHEQKKALAEATLARDNVSDPAYKAGKKRAQKKALAEATLARDNISEPEKTFVEKLRGAIGKTDEVFLDPIKHRPGCRGLAEIKRTPTGGGLCSCGRLYVVPGFSPPFKAVNDIDDQAAPSKAPEQKANAKLSNPVKHRLKCGGFIGLASSVSGSRSCSCGFFHSAPDISPSQAANSKALKQKASKAPVAGGVLQLFPRSMHILALLSKAGADKYGTTVSTIQFMDTPGAYELHTDAMVRHVVDEKLEGPVNHKDGGALHPAQAAWNALARLEVFLRNAEESNHDTN